MNEVAWLAIRLQFAAPAMPMAAPDAAALALDWNRSVASEVTVRLSAVSRAPSSSQAAALFSTAARVIAAAAVKSAVPLGSNVRSPSSTSRSMPARKSDSAPKIAPDPVKSDTVANERVCEARVSDVARMVTVTASTNPAISAAADDE